MKMGLIDAKVMDESQLMWLSGCRFRAKKPMIYQFSIQNFTFFILLSTLKSGSNDEVAFIL